ncbi:sulfatase-like hydrolase/transferase [Oceaniferula marina]|nr:sulfatase-like hydrolase/transferase [Oceaniferula marina]
MKQKPIKTWSQLGLMALFAGTLPATAAELIHDADHYILKAQHGEQWAKDDAAVNARLEEFKKKNGGKSPNILYILIDDMGYGDMGIPELNGLRGYETPNVNKFSDESMRLNRMYTEPSCTPTRCAFMTGRQPHRYNMGDTAVDIAGFGLPAKEKTLPEVLSEAGYNTTHIGKWHMGDIKESWPHNQGFDYAAFPIHQQGQLTVFNDDAAKEGVAVSIGPGQYNDRFTKDKWFRPNPAAMVVGCEATKGGTVREVHMKPGERWTEKKYEEMNQRYQDQTLEHLRKLAKQDKPFFLQYWPLIPLSNPRATTDNYTTPNGGTYVEKMKKLDGWIGDILEEVDKLKLAENTIVVIMGDNGHFTKYSPGSGYTAMIFKGGKADTTEGGVRVDAFVRWPGMIEKDSIVNDIVHVADLYTTLSVLAGAKDKLPTDRLIDGVDQSALLLEGETKGRRDTVFIYSGPKMEAVVKEHIKLKVPGPGENPIGAKFYDLQRDTREEYPVSTEIGAWGGAEMVRVIQRHMVMKKKYPDTDADRGLPYDGIENLRPETKAAVQAFLIKNKILLEQKK